MNQEERLKEVFGKDAGWRVPDGYFESFYKNMGENLPAMPAIPKKPDLSLWQRIKPYAYLAAMFAGIWMMMKVFHTVYQDSTFNIDNPPENIAMLMASDPDLDLYADIEYSADDEIDSIIGSYDNMSDLEKDMGLRLEPAFEKLDVEAEIEKK